MAEQEKISEGLPYIRCPLDGKVILKYENGKPFYDSCAHLHWHETKYPEIPEKDPNKVSDDDEIDWDDFLKLRHITRITVNGEKLYLVWYLVRISSNGFPSLDGKLPSDKRNWIFIPPYVPFDRSIKDDQEKE
jgi:hypothetical protein